MVKTFDVNGYEVMGVLDKGNGEFAVLGKEVQNGQDYWCTWIGNKDGLMLGHYMMSKERAIKDWLDR